VSHADAFLAADPGAFLAFGGQEVAVAGVGVAPAEVGVQGPGLSGVVGVVGVGDGELSQGSEVGFDRVGPGRVGRGEAQLAQGAPRLTRATVNLTPKSVRAIEGVAATTGDTRTDIINRAVQVYAEIQQVRDDEGELYVRPVKGDDIQLLRFW
jgi:hypothetical protein